MTTLLWILLGGLLMSAIALVGSVALLLSQATLEKVLLPLVSFAAGSLIGGSLFHMIPAALANMPVMSTFVLVALGFALFFLLSRASLGVRLRRPPWRNGRPPRRAELMQQVLFASTEALR